MHISILADGIISLIKAGGGLSATAHMINQAVVYVTYAAWLLFA